MEESRRKVGQRGDHETVHTQPDRPHKGLGIFSKYDRNSWRYLAGE